MKSAFLAPLALLTLAAMPACRSTNDNAPDLDQRIDDAMLQYASSGDRKDINDARSAAAEARDAYAAAQLETSRAMDRRKLADQDLQIAQDRVERNSAAVDIAQNGTQEQLDRARQDLADARTVIVATKSRIRLRDRQVERAKAYENLKQKNNALAQAKVEAVKAHAVHDANRPDTRMIDVDAFERQVREAQASVDIAQAKLDAARKEVDVANNVYDSDVKAVPSAYRRDWPKEETPSKDESKD